MLYVAPTAQGSGDCSGWANACTLQHALSILDQSGQEFQPFVHNAQAADLDRLFSAYDVALLFYGHNHRESDVIGRARYVNPARELGPNEGVLLTYEEGLQTRTNSRFDVEHYGTHLDAPNTHLWTIDDRGINMAWEHTPFPTKRGYLVHSNLSSSAYFGGEAWFPNSTEVIINADSGRYGAHHPGVNNEMWQAAIQLWQGLGHKVTAIPFGTK